MGASKVYFTNMRCRGGETLLNKLNRLLLTAGMEHVPFDGKFVAIKIHFGELGNLAFLRPNYARVVADFIKERGGKPFLTDCSTLYVGSRKNALDHLDTAYANGFSPLSTGCQIVIADGLRGRDEVLVPVDGEYVRQARIGTAIMEADVIISLNHFKGHEGTGFGGAIKNLGMGCGSTAGKKEMHASGKPHVDQSTCVGCGICRQNCAHEAINLRDGKAGIDQSRCVGCCRCIGACPHKAVKEASEDANDILSCKMAEYASAVVKNRPQFHISLAVDISPFCDCHAENDAPILPNIGMFASFDPVALDQACADACLREEPIRHTRLDEMPHVCSDHFCNSQPGTNWRIQLEHAERMGMGQRNYELIEME